MAKTMDHNEYIAKTKTMTEEQLRYVRADAKRAMDAMPDGPNAGYYADEVCYCGMELARRAKKQTP